MDNQASKKFLTDGVVNSPFTTNPLTNLFWKFCSAANKMFRYYNMYILEVFGAKYMTRFKENFRRIYLSQ